MRINIVNDNPISFGEIKPQQQVGHTLIKSAVEKYEGTDGDIKLDE